MASAEPAKPSTLLAGALALFVAAPLVAVGLTGMNVWRGFDAIESAVAREAAVGQIERRTAAGAAGGPSRDDDMASLYLTASSPTLARAELQQIMGRLVDRASARLIEVRGQDEDGTEPTGGIQLQLTLDATNESLFKLLYEIETGVPLLSAEQIGIRKVPGRTGAPEIDPTLRATLVVRGHWRGTAK